jgi:DNA-binding XRE family transcriptional regulator
MNNQVKKLVEHQVKSEISEEKMCSDIGIARKTFYNLKKEITKPHESTLEVIDKYITKENIDVV